MTAVYVIQAEGGPVKVGIATDLAKRLAVLRSASPLPLEVAYAHEVACSHRAAAIEKTALTILETDRSHGSWFKVSAEVATAAIQLAILDPHSRAQGGPQRAARGAALRRAREAQGWSVERLAREGGVPIDAVLAAENGRGYESGRRRLLGALQAEGMELTDDGARLAPTP